MINIKKYLLLFPFLCCVTFTISAQTGFVFPENVNKDKISFQFLNNLVILPVSINGKERLFILDTGVNSTILFSMSEEDSLQLKNTSTIKLRGLGGGKSINALKSTQNTLSIGKAKDLNHTMYVVYESSFDLSKKMGIPIYGILGYEFFKNFVVKLNYNSKKITFYTPKSFKEKPCKKCEVLPLTFHNNKPYVLVKVLTNNQEKKEVKLLIDSGSSDALWLFDEQEFILKKPNHYFEDYLGQGLNGNIFGKRSKVKQLLIGQFTLNEVKVAFPDTIHFSSIRFKNNRNGSIGGDILKRFAVTIDYPSKKIILKKNSKFKNPFYYNMSGLTIEHDGIIMVKEKHSRIKKTDQQDVSSNTNNVESILVKEVYDFFLVPKFIVSNVRKDSPAYLAGIIKGDQVLSINGKASYNYKLSDLIAMFSSKEDRNISMVILRNNSISKKKFTLKKVI